MHPERLAENPGNAMSDLSDSSVTPRNVTSWRCRVLVVDDDELVRAELAALLEPAGYEVYVAGSAEEGLLVLRRVSCHIVLTDWQLPDMDGLALCRKLRLADNEGYVYVLMLTVRATNSTFSPVSALALMTMSLKELLPKKSWHAWRWAGVSRVSSIRCARATASTGACR
jgi:CheY-like chemotaxis protein